MSDQEALQLQSAIVKPKRRVEKTKEWWAREAYRHEQVAHTLRVQFDVQAEQLSDCQRALSAEQLTRRNTAHRIAVYVALALAVGVTIGKVVFG